MHMLRMTENRQNACGCGLHVIGKGCLASPSVELLVLPCAAAPVLPPLLASLDILQTHPNHSAPLRLLHLLLVYGPGQGYPFSNMQFSASSRVKEELTVEAGLGHS